MKGIVASEMARPMIMTPLTKAVGTISAEKGLFLTKTNDNNKLFLLLYRCNDSLGSGNDLIDIKVRFIIMRLTTIFRISHGTCHMK
jgi:hypothetical protein